jgi:hypothetical protein
VNALTSVTWSFIWMVGFSFFRRCVGFIFFRAIGMRRSPEFGDSIWPVVWERKGVVSIGIFVWNFHNLAYLCLGILWVRKGWWFDSFSTYTSPTQ